MTAQAAPPRMGGVARGGAANLVGALVLAASTFALTLVLTHGLDQNAAGILFATTSIFVIATSVGQLGTVAGLIYFIARARASGRPGLAPVYYRLARTPVLVTTLVTAVVLVVLAPQLGRLIAPEDSLEAARYIRVLSLFVPVTCLEVVTLAATRGFGTMRPTVVVEQVVRPVLQLSLVAAALWVGAGPLLVGLAWVVGYIPAAAMALYSWRSLLRRTAVPPADESPREGSSVPDHVRAFWRFTAPRALASTAQIGIQRVDVVIVAALAGPAQAALYTAATRFLVLGQMGAGSISTAVQPRLAASLTQGDHRAAGHYYRTATAWLLLLTWPIYLVFLNFGEVILRVFGSSYTAGAVVLTVLAWAMLFSTSCGMVDMVLLMAGKSTWNLVNVVVALVVQVGLDLVLIPRVGIVGAAIGWAAAIVTNNGLPLLQVVTTMRLHPFGRSSVTAMLLAVVSFGALGAGVRLLLGTSVASLLVALTAGAVVYLLGVAALRGPLELGTLRTVRRPPRPTA